MREPYTQLYVHLIWATWDRLPLLTKDVRQTVYACIQAKCTALKVDLLAIGGIENHIHLLVRIPTTITIADLAKHVKGASSHLTTHSGGVQTWFRWQGAYAAFTLMKADIPRIRAYILNQETHHHNKTLSAEDELPD